jgi:hypothetical protein
MTQAVFSQNMNHRRVPFQVIRDAQGGDIDAMTLIQRCFEQYIRRMATLQTRRTSYMNMELYDRLKTRLIIATLKFKL